MAFIPYLDQDAIPAADRVADQDNILQIHSVHSRMMPLHFDFYKELMYARGPLSRKQREMIGVVVSARNACRY